MANNFTLGQKLASLRGHYRKTQKEVSAETGIKQELISYYETDKKAPPPVKLQKLATAYFTTIKGIEQYEPSNANFNSFYDQSKGFFNISKIVLSSLDEIIEQKLNSGNLTKGNELKITVSFKIE